jgi:death-on-curing protein
VIAEAVTGLDVMTLQRVTKIELLDSALHAPQASFARQELSTAFFDKAAVLAVRISKNHPLPDGNKRSAWASCNMFLMVNGYRLDVPTARAVEVILAVAAGEINEGGLALWLEAWAKKAK